MVDGGDRLLFATCYLLRQGIPDQVRDDSV